MNQNKNESKLLFRKAQKVDAAAISQVVNSAYRGKTSQQGWTTEAHLLAGQRTDQADIEELIQSENLVFLVGEQSGELVASVLLEKKPDGICYFGMFAIYPTLQSKGLGKLFIQEAEQFARDQFGSQKMEMTVITLRTELIAWYERRGYRQTGEVRPFPYGDERFGVPLREDLKLGVLEKRL